MFGRFLRQSTSNSRLCHESYQQAKEIYDHYAREIGLELLGPTQDQQKQAQNEALLHKAEELYRQSLYLCLEQGEAYNAITVRFQLGLLKRLQGHWLEAISFFEDSLSLFRKEVRSKPDARSSVSICHFYLGQACLEVDRFQMAHDHLMSAIGIDEAMNDTRRTHAVKYLLKQCESHNPQEYPTDLSSGHNMTTKDVPNTDTIEPEEEVSPLPISPPATIWIVSQSNTAKMHVCEMTEQAIADFSNKPELIGTSLADIDLNCHPMGSLKNDSRVSAVVLIIEPSSIASPSFLTFVQWCIDQVALRGDFRLFIFIEGMTVADFNRTADSGDTILKTLIDTVQMAHTDSPREFRKLFRGYVAHLQEGRNMAAWLRLRLNASIWLGYISSGVHILCVILGVYLVFWLPVWDTQATLRQFTGNEPLVGLICTMASFPFLMIGIYTYTRYSPFLLKMHHDPLGFIWGGLFTFLGTPILCSAFRIKAPLTWILLGLVIGFFLDAGRRIGISAKRENLRVDPNLITTKHGRLPKYLRDETGAAWLNPVRCPLFPLRIPRVFISYTRSSAWAYGVAELMAKHLNDIGVKVFLDQKDIPIGANWRQFLNRHLGRCTVFICLVDNHTVGREWPAAEMEAALKGKHLNGLPHILLVKAPDLPYANKETWSWLPVFRETIKINGQKDFQSQLQVIEYSDSVPEIIAYSLHPDMYKSVSMLPAGLSDVLRSLWTALSVPLLLLSTFASFAGHLAIFLVIAELGWRVDSVTWLHKVGYMYPTYFLCAFWTGNLLRLALAARFHLRNKRASGVFNAHRDPAIILVILLIIWGIHAPAILLGWSLVVCVMGWAVSDGFCMSESRKNPGFLMPED